jgi:hypothetical protein
LDTAEQPDMPASAIGSGCIDYVLSPEEVPGVIRTIVGLQDGCESA